MVAILAVVASIALPSYSQYQKKANIATAIAEIVEIEQALEKFHFLQYAYPEFLTEIAFNRLDPWGNGYVYLNFDTVNGFGKNRKDKNLKPLNTDYDLYSMGEDGQTKSNLSNPVSEDDVIRATDGAFIGLAADF